MTNIVTSLDSTAIASATSIVVKQKSEKNIAITRPEKIVFIGQAQTNKSITTNKLYLASGNSDDVGAICGFGSPLHRMAMKLFPKAGNGSKVDTYYIAVPEPTEAQAEEKTLTISVNSNIKKSFTGKFIYNDLIFEAAADVAGKVATIAHNNPALDSRNTDLNCYEKTSIPFSITKGMTAKEAATSLKESLEEYLEIPFTIKNGETDGVLIFTAKWKGSDSFFEFEIKNENDEDIDESIYGIKFEIERTAESSGVGKIPDETFAILDEEQNFTRVVSQYSTETVLDALQEHFEAFHDGEYKQYVICYSSIQAPESTTLKGTWDIESLITFGDKRRNDSINVQIVGDFGKLKKLKYKMRNKLAKAGYSHLIQKADGSYRLMDLISFYHPQDKTNPLFRFDRDITVIGNIVYKFDKAFDTDDWKSFILVGSKDLTTNPKARRLEDVKAFVNATISSCGQLGLIANYAEAQKYTQLEIDKQNPNRININPKFDITGTGRIFDTTLFIGFNYNG